MAFPSRFPGHCSRCGQSFQAGTMITWSRRHRGKAYHAMCPGYTQPTADVEETTDIPETTPDVPQDAPSAPQSSADDAGVVATLAAALRGKLGGDLDEGKVRAIATEAATDVVSTMTDMVQGIVDEAVAKVQAQAPMVLEIRNVDGSVTKVEGGHYLLPRLIRLLAAGFNVYAWGPAGSGKTTAGMMAAEALKRQNELDTLDPSTFRSMVQGFVSPTGDHMHTSFTRCWTEGKVYIADETDNAPGHVQTLFNSALANGHAPLAWGNVERQEGFAFFGTGNTPGRPTDQFPDRRPMSAAFADRLYFMHWPLDPAIECRAAGLTVPKPPRREEVTCTPAEWGTWVRNVREWARTNAPTLMVTPRATLEGLKALALGETPEEIAHGLVFRGADEEIVSKCLETYPLPGGAK